MNNKFCIYGSFESFNDEVDEINKELREYDAEFIKPKLGGGALSNNVLSLFITVTSTFALDAAYDIFKSFIIYCLKKHRKVSKERDAKPVVDIHYRKDTTGEYTTVFLGNCSDKVVIEAIDKIFNRTENNE